MKGSVSRAFAVFLDVEVVLVSWASRSCLEDLERIQKKNRVLRDLDCAGAIEPLCNEVSQAQRLLELVEA